MSEKMLPGQETYTEEQKRQKDEMLRDACEAEEEFDLDELERHKYDVDRKYRDILEKHKVPLPDGSLGLIEHLNYRMGTQDWYAETADGKIYWFSGKEGWKNLPMGYPWLVRRFK
jgi:hypothetical protein